MPNYLLLWIIKKDTDKAFKYLSYSHFCTHLFSSLSFPRCFQYVSVASQQRSCQDLWERIQMQNDQWQGLLTQQTGHKSEARNGEDDNRLANCRRCGRTRQMVVVKTRQDTMKQTWWMQTLNQCSCQTEGTSGQGITGGRTGLEWETLTTQQDKTPQEHDKTAQRKRKKPKAEK